MWQPAYFTIPIDWSKGKLMDAVPHYIERFVAQREKEGWRLISRFHVNLIGKPEPNEPDRMRYRMWANFERAPITQTIEVPDSEKLIRRLIKKYGAKVRG